MPFWKGSDGSSFVRAREAMSDVSWTSTSDKAIGQKCPVRLGCTQNSLRLCCRP
jgi:hypothetical protein